MVTYTIKTINAATDFNLFSLKIILYLSKKEVCQFSAHKFVGWKFMCLLSYLSYRKCPCCGISSENSSDITEFVLQL